VGNGVALRDVWVDLPKLPTSLKNDARELFTTMMTAAKEHSPEMKAAIEKIKCRSRLDRLIDGSPSRSHRAGKTCSVSPGHNRLHTSI
jgi:hypothetical protein